MKLLGIHHVSLLTSMAEKNYAFYTKILGMRLVKKTVNQDDTTSYHLFYGDKGANPGSEITFFDIPRLGKTYEGVSGITEISLRVNSSDSLYYWQERFDSFQVSYGQLEKRAGRDVLPFQDYDGTKLLLVADNGDRGEAPFDPWDQSDVVQEHAILGLGPVLLTVKTLQPTENVLTALLGFKKIGSYPARVAGQFDIAVFATGEGGTGAEVHVETRSDLPRQRPGRGSVHHVAFRIPNESEYNQWAERIAQSGLMQSGKVDRYYFKALYFREPNHILFELSTDTPGFATDETIDQLGEKLALPPFLESRREEIEAKLRPLDI